MVDTMTVQQLIEKLQEYPRDLPVCTTWEGQLKPFEDDNFYLNDDQTSTTMLLIDVEQC